MTHSKGAFATDSTGRMSDERLEALKLPPTRRACREGTHIFSEFENLPGNMIRSRCPDCRESITYSAVQAEREGRA